MVLLILSTAEEGMCLKLCFQWFEISGSSAHSSEEPDVSCAGSWGWENQSLLQSDALNPSEQLEAE